MGYYVTTTASRVNIPKHRHEYAYRALCKLNDRDDLKGGGSYGGEGPTADTPRPAGMDHHPARWFSWMDANYPEKCKTLEAVLHEVGFEVQHDDAGNIIGLYYDSKTGNEEVFIAALAPFVTPGSYIEWRGEEGEMWRQEFDGRSISVRSGVVRWE